MRLEIFLSVLRPLMLVGALVAAVSAQAQANPQHRPTTPAIVVDDAFSTRAIGLDVDIYEDTSTQLSISDVRSAEYAQKFYASTKASTSFGFTSSAYWLRFALRDARSSSQQVQAGALLLTLGFVRSIILICGVLIPRASKCCISVPATTCRPRSGR